MFIYEIKNAVDNKKYYGQTSKKNPMDRWCAHKYELVRGVHKNKHLQNAWNKYGSSAFTYTIVQTAITLHELNVVERQYIQEHRTFDSNFGYNIAMGGHSFGTHARSSCNKLSKTKRPQGWPNVIDPSGAEHSVLSLHKFCVEHQLGYSTMYRLMEGKIRYYKGWHLPGTDLRLTRNEYKSKLAKPEGFPHIQSPDGTIFEITTLREFCRVHNLKRSSVRAVLTGEFSHTKGWSLVPKSKLSY